MERKKSHFLVKLIAIALVISLCAPIGAQAAMPETVQPMASAYLTSYRAYICAMGNGDLEIWWEVTGTRTLADIGVLAVYLYESTDGVNWGWVKSFQFTEYPHMLWHNNYICVDHVEYDGVPGRYYKAYVGIWGGPDPGGDSRYIWTSSERAT
jgi:hypothetical protein